MKTFKLINIDEQGTLGQGNIDIEIDINGNPLLIEKEQMLEQAVMKAIVTRQIDSGYGTILMDMRGEKNKRVFIALATFSIMTSLKVLQQTQQDYYAKFNTEAGGSMNPEEVLENITDINVIQEEKQKVIFEVNLTSRANTVSKISQGIA